MWKFNTKSGGSKERLLKAKPNTARADDGLQKADDGTSSFIMLGKMMNKPGKLTLISRASGTACQGESRLSESA